MKPLSLSDRRHVEAAKGWCELHAFTEANAELEEVAAEQRAQPHVLEVRWQVYANIENWEGALELANAIARMLPSRPDGYIYTASSLRDLGREDEALLALLQAVDLFPQDEILLSEPVWY